MDLFTSLRKATALERLADLEEQNAALFAAQAQALVDVEDLCRAQPEAEKALEFVALDIATACDIAQATATARLTKAKHLLHDLPLTYEHLRTRQLRVAQALAVLEETTDLPVETCAAVEAKAFPQILGMTPGDTRRTVKRIIVTVDAQASEARRQAKIKARQVWHTPRPDGRALIGAELSAEDAIRHDRALSALAKTLYGTADPRTLDQQRADLFSELPHFALTHLEVGGPTLREFLGLTDPTGAANGSGGGSGSGPGGGSGSGGGLTRRQARKVQAVIVVPCETGLDLTDSAADLIDYGPITALHARDLLAAAELRKACSDLRTGRLIALEDTILRPTQGDWTPSLLELHLLAMVDRRTHAEDRVEPAHDPSDQLTDFIQLRDNRCVGPGCSHPAHRCDLEHHQPHPDGPTTATNLGPASRRCHNAKTYGGWTLHPHPDGSITWTNPHGRSFTRPPRTTPPDLTHLRNPAHHNPSGQPKQDRHDSTGDNTGDDPDEPTAA